MLLSPSSFLSLQSFLLHTTPNPPVNVLRVTMNRVDRYSTVLCVDFVYILVLVAPRLGTFDGLPNIEPEPPYGLRSKIWSECVTRVDVYLALSVLCDVHELSLTDDDHCIRSMSRHRCIGGETFSKE